ncbi:MAG: hypothetical protein ACI8P9_001937 [Parasphingorhabdus sp.]|jgi:hypothetical protein
MKKGSYCAYSLLFIKTSHHQSGYKNLGVRMNNPKHTPDPNFRHVARERLDIISSLIEQGSVLDVGIVDSRR